VGHKNRNEVADAWEEIHKKMSTPVSVTDLKKKKGCSHGDVSQHQA
jgi:hypothetical protein